MRWILRIIIIIVLLFTGYWFGLAYLLKDGLNNALDQARQNGMQAQADLSVRGFPARFDLIAQDIDLYDPVEGNGWQSAQAHLYAVAWAPWHMIAALPQEQKLIHQGQSYTLGSTALRGSLRLSPLPSLPLSDLRISAERLALQGAGADYKTGPAIVALRAAGGTFYQFGGDIRDIELPQAWRALLPPTQSDLPQKVETLSARVIGELTAPLDRNLGQEPLGLKSVEIEEFRALWGEMELSGTGRLVADPQGLAEGKITLRMSGWRALPPLLVAAKVVPAQYAGLLTTFLGAMAAQNGGEHLSVDLVAQSGRMLLGPIPLGDAPRLLPPL